uniref:hypothetical protein n=1 Tax=Marinobacterium profundum TaxID=1714300 RepID=UPI001315A688
MRQLTRVSALLRTGLPRVALGAAVLSTTVLGGLVSAAAVAQTVVATESVAVSQSPVLGEGRFESIDSALARYRELTLEYRWPPIVTTATLRLGDSDA